jgi:TonB family protein
VTPRWTRALAAASAIHGAAIGLLLVGNVVPATPGVETLESVPWPALAVSLVSPVVAPPVAPPAAAVVPRRPLYPGGAARAQRLATGRSDTLPAAEPPGPAAAEPVAAASVATADESPAGETTDPAAPAADTASPDAGVIGAEIGGGGGAGDAFGGLSAATGSRGGGSRRHPPPELFARIVGGGAAPAVAAHADRPFLSLKESTALRVRDHFPRLPAALWPSFHPYVVRVELCVSEEGEVTDAVLLSNASARLDPLVLDAVRTWRYEPRLVAGRPDPFCHSVVIEYAWP